MESEPNTILLLGRPGSGKGTQTKILSQALGWKTLSSGDRFKEIRDGEGALSERVRATYDTGRVLPDWLPMYLLEEALLNMEDSESIVVEGFGRTKSQAETIERVLAWLGRRFVVISLDVSEQEAMRRMLERAKSEHRPDSDVEEKIRERFDEFRNNTEPALDYFKSVGKLLIVNGEQAPEQVAHDIQTALNLTK